jgi:hypothetical protein
MNVFVWIEDLILANLHLLWRCARNHAWLPSSLRRRFWRRGNGFSMVQCECCGKVWPFFGSSGAPCGRMQRSYSIKHYAHIMFYLARRKDQSQNGASGASACYNRLKFRGLYFSESFGNG